MFQMPKLFNKFINKITKDDDNTCPESKTDKNDKMENAVAAKADAITAVPERKTFWF